MKGLFDISKHIIVIFHINKLQGKMFRSFHWILKRDLIKIQHIFSLKMKSVGRYDKVFVL